MTKTHRAACLMAAAFAAGSVLTGCSTSLQIQVVGDPSHRAGVAGGVPVSIAEDSFLAQYAETYRFHRGVPVRISPTPDGSAVLFLRSGARDAVQNLYEFDTATGEERLLATAEQILQGAEEHLTAEELARRERTRSTARGISSFKMSKDGGLLVFGLSGSLYVVDRASGSVNEIVSDKGYPIDPQFSPDGSMIACVRDSEVFVHDLSTGDEKQVTFGAGGAGGTITNGLSEFIAQEEMGRYHGYWWSPDSRSIVFQQTDVAGLETMYIMDPTSPGTAPTEWPYPRPGKKNAEVRLGVVSAQGGDPIWFSWDFERSPYLASVKWEELEVPLTLVVQNRRQTEEVILEADPETGSTRTLFIERDSAWVDIDQRVPRWLTDGESFLWTTERDGAWQLELRDRTGEFLRTLTSPDWRFRSLVSVDEETGSVVISASPTDELETHLLRISLDDSQTIIERMTRRPGSHSVVFSKDNSISVRTSRPRDGERSITVRRADGSLIGKLGDVSERPPFEPNVEWTTVGRDLNMQVAIIRPRNFDPSLRYPVIDYVYAGPTTTMVGASRSRYVLHQWFADHGFIVVSIDGRGTPRRGRDWNRAVKNDLISVPLEDQATALRLLGKKYPEMDTSRVGVFGWSFGGYFSAMAVSRMPETFHVGVAGAPVTDWLDYDTHYTERYMDLPENNPEGYVSTNVMTYAENLSRPLMILHGTADDNVYFMHSLKLADALFREGKDFELVPLIGFTHMVPDPMVTTRLYSRIIGYFTQHLTQPE